MVICSGIDLISAFISFLLASTYAMTDYPAPETLSCQDLGPILDKLQLLLENLPKQLPSKPVSGPDASRYVSLVSFQPDEEFLEMTGSRAGALNMHHEHLFGHAARSSGDIGERSSNLRYP